MIWIFWLAQVLFDNSTLVFNLVRVLVQDLTFHSLLKVINPLEDFTRCYIQYIDIKKEKIKLFLTDLTYFLYHILRSLVLWHISSVKSLK